MALDRRERDPQTERARNRSPSEESTTSVHNRRVETEKLSRQFRQETAGRKKFVNFTRDKYWQAAALFVDAGYTSVDCVRQMQEQARQYFLTDLRKGNAERKTLRDLRLIMDLFDLFVIQKDEEKPKFEEITIPEKLKHWSPSLTNLRGTLLPDQDMCNHFSFELAKGACKKPPIVPFVLGELHKKPWVPQESSHTRALDAWKVLQKSHKRPSNCDLGFQAWITYSLRFILSGDLVSAWKTFGGIALQFTHLGTVLNMAVTENATIAQLYDAKVRTYANELSKFRERDTDIIKLLQEEDQRIKREVLRECGITQTFALPTWKENKGGKRKKEKGKGKGKNKKTYGKGRGHPSNGDWNNRGWRGKTYDWQNANGKNQGGNGDTDKQHDEGASGKPADEKKKPPSKKKKT